MVKKCAYKLLKTTCALGANGYADLSAFILLHFNGGSARANCSAPNNSILPSLQKSLTKEYPGVEEFLVCGTWHTEEVAIQCCVNEEIFALRGLQSNRCFCFIIELATLGYTSGNLVGNHIQMLFSSKFRFLSSPTTSYA